MENSEIKTPNKITKQAINSNIDNFSFNIKYAKIKVNTGIKYTNIAAFEASIFVNA